MIEAAICFLLISFGLGVWGFAALCRRIYSRPRPPGAGPDDSLLAKLFTPGPTVQPVRIPTEPPAMKSRDGAGS